MRVLQLIDSLHPGGAETVAVTYANALAEHIDKSLLCATREEGLLKNQLDKTVPYLFLARTKTLDLKAIGRLVRFCKKHGVSHIHAHSSSFFIARMALLFLPECSLVWHDHYGKSEALDERPYKMLSWCSRKFTTIIAVNEQLQAWAKRRLHCKQVLFLKNAVPTPEANQRLISIQGIPGKRIVQLANFREQKDHLNMLEAFSLLHKEDSQVHLHLVGMHWKDAYYSVVIAKIESLRLNKSITVHGPLQDVYQILLQCDIGVLSSNSEGLPMALLEYGMAGLAVVCTDVGQCANVIEDKGQLAPANNAVALANALALYINNPELRQSQAKAFKNHIKQEYSIQSIIPKLLKIYEPRGKTN